MSALRPYQAEAVEQLRAAYRGGARAPLLQLPTGAGKTHVFVAVREGAARRGKSVLVTVHRRELLKQASRKLTEAGVAHGVIAPGHPSTDHPVQVGSVQTLARRLDSLPKFDVIVLDEGHHVTATQWRSLLASQPQARVLGVSACPTRADGRGLGVSGGGPFDALVTGPSMRELIER